MSRTVRGFPTGAGWAVGLPLADPRRPVLGLRDVWAADGARDVITGAKGTDWFVAAGTDRVDRTGIEQVLTA